MNTTLVCSSDMPRACVHDLIICVEANERQFLIDLLGSDFDLTHRGLQTHLIYVLIIKSICLNRHDIYPERNFNEENIVLFMFSNRN